MHRLGLVLNVGFLREISVSSYLVSILVLELGVYGFLTHCSLRSIHPGKFSISKLTFLKYYKKIGLNTV